MEGSSDEVERKVRALALVDRILDVDPATATGPELSALMAARAELAAITDGAVVAAMAQWEASADWAVDGSATVVTHLVNHTGAHRSSAGVLRRTGLDAASMPHVHAAAVEGALPLSHLTLLTRARTAEVAELFDRDEAMLVAEARTLTADRLAIRLAEWRYAALAEAGENEPDAPPDHASEADTAKIVTGFAGRGLVTMDLTPESLATITAAVHARIESWRSTGQLTEDTRSWEELVGAAIVELIADGSTSVSHGKLRPLLVVTAKLRDLFDRAGIAAEERTEWTARILGGGPIGQAALRELMEQADLQFVVTDDDGEPLYVGRAKRFATAVQIVALFARAGRGCEFPGCHAHHHRSHAHHIIWWEDDGRTDIDNLALLCPHHHRLIHKAGFTLVRGPTGLEFRRPDGSLIEPPPFAHAA